MARGGAHRRARILAAALALAAVDTSAVAQAAPDDAERARTLVYRGDDLFTEKRFGEALQAYEEADRLMRVPTTRVEVAKTLSAMGRLSEARETARAVEQMPVVADEPLPFWEARQRATALIREIDRRMPAVALDIVPRVKRRVVRVDREVVPDALTWAPIRVDPGRHVVTVEAEGFKTLSRTVDVSEGQKVDVAMKLDEATRGPSPISITGFVVSGLALTGGIFASAMYLKERGDLEDACAARDPACGQVAYDRANAFGWAADISFALALAGAALGGVTYAIDISAESKARVQLVGAPNGAAIRVEL